VVEESDGDLMGDVVNVAARLEGIAMLGPHVSVIARNSIFRFKGQAVNIRQVAQDLDVRCVLEGSGRTSRIRITAQLIEAGSGRHLWADRFEGSWTMSSTSKIRLWPRLSALLSRPCDKPTLSDHSRKAG